MPIIGAAYLRCSDPRQDKSIEQQQEAPHHTPR